MMGINSFPTLLELFNHQGQLKPRSRVAGTQTFEYRHEIASLRSAKTIPKITGYWTIFSSLIFLDLPLPAYLI